MLASTSVFCSVKLKGGWNLAVLRKIMNQVKRPMVSIFKLILLGSSKNLEL
ncbi:hypothetical protein ES288_D01G089100v1 [Gossypium darwinii]|uniref:Uncharacterized protein n=1 Tax=Gossypium darwinii TaxID=34276 RepID=A0A5D2DN12_GOSDA|nr:hypothetical protein ES288_D01G089100v1 [Gossypium darwinii]